jgi:hypothetical protein
MLLSVLRPTQSLCLLLVAWTSARGQSLSLPDSTHAKQAIRRAFLRHDEWLNASDEADRCYFPTKREAKSAVDHLRVVPVRYLDYQRFQVYRMGHAVPAYYVPDPNRRLGLLRQ